MRNADLKPCPFCGSSHVFYSPIRDDNGDKIPSAWMVSCEECQINFSCGHSRVKDITELWNRRVSERSDGFSGCL